MAQRWLVKTEPGTYSFQQLRKDRRTVWDGVKNALALKHIAQIRKGDSVLVYHTGDEKAVVGRARAASDAYADPRADDPRLLVFDLEAEEALSRPVTLSEIKAERNLAELALVRMPRLSVMPLSEEQWAEIERLARRG